MLVPSGWTRTATVKDEMRSDNYRLCSSREPSSTLLSKGGVSVRKDPDRSCPGCRGYGWKRVTSRLDAAFGTVEEEPSAAGQRACSLCGGTGEVRK